jgi:hypothetical protein
MIEVMLSIALFTSIAGASAVALYSIDQGTSLDRTAMAVGNALRHAELNAIGMEYDSPWGVEMTSSTVTVFYGQTYETRYQPADVVTDLPPSITASGIEEIRFARATGKPHVTGNITLSTAYDSRTITITEDGSILY